MNQDQQFLLKNLQNMIKYIQQETEKKVQIIKKDAIKDAELGNKIFNRNNKYKFFLIIIIIRKE
jgi:hypothetical protein